MALKEYLENYKPPQMKRGYFYGTEKREAEWEQVLQALEEGYKDTTALVNWLVDECGCMVPSPSSSKHLSLSRSKADSSCLSSNWAFKA